MSERKLNDHRSSRVTFALLDAAFEARCDKVMVTYFVIPLHSNPVSAYDHISNHYSRASPELDPYPDPANHISLSSFFLQPSCLLGTNA